MANGTYQFNDDHPKRDRTPIFAVVVVLLLGFLLTAVVVVGAVAML